MKPALAIPSGANALALMLAGLAMLGPFAVDTYLPAFPAISSSLHATPLQVQQTLSAYMLSFAIMTLWHGAFADAFGRRRVILWALLLFALASLGCAAADSIHVLWLFRILQGVSAGAGIVIGRAIIRDLYSGAQATRLLSLVTMIFSIAPALAPITGGWIVTLFGWREIFLALFLFTLLLLAYCYRRLPETLPPSQRQPFRPGFLWQSYRLVFSSWRFHLLAGLIACNFAGLFLYVAAAPVFLSHHLGLQPNQFGWQFVPAVAGLFLGSLAANRMAGKLGVVRQLQLAFCLLVGAALANALYHLFFPAALPWSVAPLFFYTFGMSLAMPGATLLVLDLFPTIRGIVASCQSFAMTLLAAVVAGMVAPLLSGSPLWLALGQLVFSLLALALWQLVLRSLDQAALERVH